MTSSIELERSIREYIEEVRRFKKRMVKKYGKWIEKEFGV
jgi:hypothetical protein